MASTRNSHDICMYKRSALPYTQAVKVDGFDWDSGNSFKNEAKHGISRETVEAFFGRKGLGGSGSEAFTDGGSVPRYRTWPR